MKSDAKVIFVISALTVAFVAFIAFTAGSTKPVDASLINTGKNVRGPDNAKNTLVEFSDFFCPSCKAAEPYLNQVISQHQNNLKFIYRHFPLPQHPLAFKASQAAEAAALQGKFWEYKEILFKDQDFLTENSFKEIARKLDLNLDKFTRDMDSKEVLEIIQNDLSAGRQLNLPGTPSLFLNGEKLNFSSFAELPKTVESKIEK